MENRICSLFGIRYPIVAGGMIWCSGWRLAAYIFSDTIILILISANILMPEKSRTDAIQFCNKKIFVLPRHKYLCEQSLI